jgi:hypothetical protein
MRASILASARSFLLGRRLNDPLDVLPRIEADVGHHHRGEDVVRVAKFGHGDLATPQIADSTDALAAEEFVAADVHSPQEHDRLAGVDQQNEVGAVVHGDIDLSGGERFHGPAGRALPDQVLRVTEALGLEQLLGDELGRGAERRNLAQSKAGRFRRRLGAGGSRWQSEQNTGADGGDAAEEAPTVNQGSTPSRVRRQHSR